MAVKFKNEITILFCCFNESVVKHVVVFLRFLCMNFYVHTYVAMQCVVYMDVYESLVSMLLLLFLLL